MIKLYVKDKVGGFVTLEGETHEVLPLLINQQKLRRILREEGVYASYKDLILGVVATKEED